MKPIDTLSKKAKNKAQPKKTKKTVKTLRKKKRKTGLLVFGAIFTLLALLVLYLIFEEFIYYNRPFPNIYIAGVELTSKNIKNQLRDKTISFQTNSKLNIKYQDKNWEFIPNEENVNYNIDSGIINAKEFGRSGKYYIQLYDRLRLLFFKQNVPLPIKTNDDKLAELTDIVKKDVEYNYQNASLRFDGLNLLDIDAKPGLKINSDDLIKKIDNSCAYLKTSDIELKTDETQPKITQKDTTDARKTALLYISNAVSTTYQDKIIEFQPANIAGWIVFIERIEAESTLKDKLPFINQPKLIVSLDEEKIKNEVFTQFGNIETPAENVRLSFTDKLNIVSPSKSGYGINYKQLVADLETVLAKIRDRKVSIKLQNIRPEITENDLNKLGIVELIGSGISSTSGSSWNRIKNIRVGSEKINGYLIKPDEIFSLNTNLGPIDGEHGFVPELVIKENKTIPEYGGGLCQVGTTTFRAALMSGLPIVERKNHAYRVHYYEWPYGPGVDATIYPPHPDVQFKNDTGHYILIQTKLVGNVLTYDFYGTKSGREGRINKPIVLWSLPDGSLATIFSRDIIVNGKVVETNEFKSLYNSPDLYPTLQQ